MFFNGNDIVTLYEIFTLNITVIDVFLLCKMAAVVVAVINALHICIAIYFLLALLICPSSVTFFRMLTVHSLYSLAALTQKHYIS